MTLFFRFVFKLVEKLLVLRTRLVYFKESDPTQILLDTRTARQAELDAEVSRFSYGAEVSPTRVLVVVPFRDNPELTRKCVDSLLQQSLPAGLVVHLCLADNGSKERNTLEWLEELKQTSRGSHNVTLEVIRLDYPFNFSKINNDAVSACQHFGADYLFFVNNDIEFCDTESCAKLVAAHQRLPQAGAVGCTLLYPGGGVQHLFLAPGIKVMGGHPFRGSVFRFNEQWFAQPRAVPAVTGAALLVKQADFKSVGGFDESLAAGGNDLDLCLKLQKIGRINWTLPKVLLIHHETVSRTKRHNRREIDFLYQKWGKILLHNEYFSDKLSRWSEEPTLASCEGDYPWRLTIPNDGRV